MSNAAAFAALARVRLAVTKLSRVPAQAAATGARAIKDLLQAQVASERDPYGRPWAPHTTATVKRWGEHSIGYLTGGMVGGLDVKPARGAGIQITLGASRGAPFFQLGTVQQKARPILPTGALPASWASALRLAATKACQQTMAGA
ncbi:MAG: hypothetical protein ACLP1Q_08450 [Solirubrobacteraceae bacterium]